MDEFWRLIARHHVVLVWFGLPCSSFSRARRGGAGPPPLRSDEKPMGLDNLSPANQLKVDVGNTLLRITVRVCRRLSKQKVAWAIENSGLFEGLDYAAHASVDAPSRLAQGVSGFLPVWRI